MTSQCPCFELSMGKPVPFDTHLHIRYYSRGDCHSKFIEAGCRKQKTKKEKCSELGLICISLVLDCYMFLGDPKPTVVHKFSKFMVG